MKLGLPRETKPGERRVALLPEAVAAIAAAGHQVQVQAGAGEGVGIGDCAYRDAGAVLVEASQAWRSDLVVKVKELQDDDIGLLPDGICLFSFHHLPGEPERARALAKRGTTAIAFEMVREADGTFPLLAPMSVIAGRMAIEVAERTLGRAPERVLVLGAGHAGLSAAATAQRRGARVTVLTRSPRSQDEARARGFDAALATAQAIEQAAPQADVVVGAVFVPASPTPKLLPRSLVRRMKRGAMIVDVSIDAGGVAETSRPTTHAQPTFVEEGVIHYGVANMPAAEPQAASRAISEAALPFVQEISAKGVARAVRDNAALRAGVLLWKGRLNHAGIAAECGLPYTALSDPDLA